MSLLRLDEPFLNSVRCENTEVFIELAVEKAALDCRFYYRPNLLEIDFSLAGEDELGAFVPGIVVTVAIDFHQELDEDGETFQPVLGFYHVDFVIGIHVHVEGEIIDTLFNWPCQVAPLPLPA